MIYRQLLVMDHNSENWAWEFDRIGALNKRHQVTRVSSQLRKEAQQVFYTSIPWQIRVQYHRKGYVNIDDKVLRILWSLQDWDQLRNIWNVRLTFTIQVPQKSRGRTHSDQVSAEKSPSICSMAKFCHLFAQLQHVEIAWLDSARTITWAQKARDLLQPLRHINSLRTCKINHVTTDGQADEIRGFVHRTDFAERVKEAAAISNVDLNPVIISCRHLESSAVS